MLVINKHYIKGLLWLLIKWEQYTHSTKLRKFCFRKAAMLHRNIAKQAYLCVFEFRHSNGTFPGLFHWNRNILWKCRNITECLAVSIKTCNHVCWQDREVLSNTMAASQCLQSHGWEMQGERLLRAGTKSLCCCRQWPSGSAFKVALLLTPWNLEN